MLRAIDDGHTSAADAARLMESSHQYFDAWAGPLAHIRPDDIAAVSQGLEQITYIVNADRDYVATPRLAVTFQNGEGGHQADSLAFSPDGRTLAMATDGGTTQLWNVATHRLAATLPSGGDTVNSVAFSPDGETLAMATDGGTTQLVDVATRRLIVDLPDNDGNPLDAVAFSPDGRTLAAGTSGGSVQLSDMATVSASIDPLAVLPAANAPGQVDPTAFSPDGMTMAVGTVHGTTQLWNVATRRLAATLGPGRANWQVYAVAFSPDGKLLAVGGAYGAQLWDVATRRPSQAGVG